MLDQLPNVSQMIRMTRRWSILELPCIDVPKTYLGLFMIFDEEIDHVRKTFEDWKLNPPIGRTQMPISGRIAWAQGLARRLREPFDEFMKMKFVFFQPRDAGAGTV